MSAPTGLTIKNNLNDMQIGDCIPCRYTAISGVAGYFSELGTCTAAEIPLTGTPTPDGLFYAIKVDKGTLIADRVIQTSISWDMLNKAKFIEGGTPEKNLIKGALLSTTYSNWGYSLDTIRDDYITGPWNYCVDSNNQANIIIDLKSSYRVDDIKGILDTDVLSQYNSKVTLLFSNDGVNYNEYGYIEHLTQPTGLVSAIKTFSGEVNCRFIKLQNFIKNGTYPHAVINELQILQKSNYIIRSMTGGIAYIDDKGNQSTTDKGLGAWPPNNEWDKYLVNSDLKGKIIKGDDNIWHRNFGSQRGTWCKDTPLISSVNRTYRYDATFLYNRSSDSSWPGFRPVLNYVESDIVSEVI